VLTGMLNMGTDKRRQGGMARLEVWDYKVIIK